MILDSEEEGDGDREEEEEDISIPQIPRSNQKMMSFDAVLDNIKKSYRRRKKPTEITADIEGEVISFIKKMEQAIANDFQALRDKKPATQRIKMLNDVLHQLSKVHLQETLLNNNILTTIRTWLEPLPDGTLPSMNIRSGLLNILNSKYDTVSPEHLKPSKIGQVVMILWKHPQETPQNKRIAQDLIEKWSRPLFGLSTNYQNMNHSKLATEHVKRSSSEGYTTRPPVSQSPEMSFNELLDRRTQETTSKTLSYRARIPQQASMDYTKRPVSNFVPKEVKKTSKTDKELLKNLRTPKSDILSSKKVSHSRAVRIGITSPHK